MGHTSVMLSDDHPFIRRGLRTILESTKEYEVCGETGDGDQTLEFAARLKPDILILDISMPGPNGLEVAHRIRQSLPQIKILIITMHDSEEILRAAAAVGVDGYLLKSDAEQLLIDALGSLLQGQPFVSPAFDRETVRQLFH